MEPMKVMDARRYAFCSFLPFTDSNTVIDIQTAGGPFMDGSLDLDTHWNDGTMEQCNDASRRCSC